MMKVWKIQWRRETAQMKTTYAFLKGRYYGRYLVLSILTIYGEYEVT
jgi:hypothetical protein